LAEAPAEEILTVPEVARWLGLGDNSIRNRARSGALPARRVGSSWRFARDHVAAVLAGGGAETLPASAPAAFTEPEPLMSATEAARWLRVSRAGIYKELAAGRIPARKERSQWQFSRAELLQWLRGDPEAEAARYRRPPRRRR
jgi:excisionase family DNA binding protein